MTCPVLSAEANCEVTPSSCLNAPTEFNESCRYICNSGYHSNGWNNTRKCQHDKTWDGTEQHFNCSSLFYCVYSSILNRINCI